MSGHVDVAAGILINDEGRVLLGRRPTAKVYAGYWEFPGGKVEAGESTHQALVRELREELDIEVTHAYPWLTQTFTYPHATVRLQFFRVTAWIGTPVAKEHQALDWQHPTSFDLEPMLPANTPVLRALALPQEYAITDIATIGESAFLRRLDERLAGGLRMIQLREKSASRPELIRIGQEIVSRARRYRALVMVNSEAPIAQSIGADGIHLTSAALLAAGARPGVRWVGASCHDPDELQRAARLGVDFAVLGPVQTTASHPRSIPIGWTQFAALARNAGLPVYAVGGLTHHDIETAWQHGAHGVAMIRGSWD